MKRDDRQLRVGILGCGPIAQMAHFDACAKSRNVELYAICDVADDLRRRMEATWEPKVAYSDYDQLLADPQVEAIIVAVADQYHVPLSLKAIEAGKHVLVEKPLGVSLEECEALKSGVAGSSLTLQVGNNRRFEQSVLP